jgi:hypothetical protein
MALTRRLVKGQAITAAEHDANVDHFEQNPNGVYMPKTAGVGMKLDPASPSFGWRDINGLLEVDRDTGATIPTFITYVGSIKQRQFAVNDMAHMQFHLPHDYLPNSTIYVHVHWSHNSLTVTTGAPTFIFDATYSKGFNQSFFGTPSSVTITESASTTRYQHMVTESTLSAAAGAGGLIDTADLEVDGIIFGSITLDSNTMDGGALPFVHYVDIHYQSTNMPTIDKSPDFYTL